MGKYITKTVEFDFLPLEHQFGGDGVIIVSTTERVFRICRAGDSWHAAEVAVGADIQFAAFSYQDNSQLSFWERLRALFCGYPRPRISVTKGYTHKTTVPHNSLAYDGLNSFSSRTEALAWVGTQMAAAPHLPNSTENTDQ